MNKKWSLALKRILLLPLFIICTLLVIPVFPLLVPVYLIDFAFDTDYCTDIFMFVYTPADIVGGWMKIDIIYYS